MSKRVSNWDAAPLIKSESAFKNSTGSFTGEAARGWASSGRLSGADLEALERDQGSIRYVVWSYATPIGWVNGETGQRHVVSQKFSQTTTRHQTVLRSAWGAA